ncbi:MAG: sugar ABC transporter ATP-binding protein [Leucobacter sp.]
MSAPESHALVGATRLITTVEGAAVEVRNVDKVFGGNVALRDVSVRVQPGTVHAFVGENGAGKSTLAKIIAGVQKADGGTLLVDGEEVEFSGPHEAKNHGIAMVHQELSVKPSLSVAENVLFGLEPTRAGFVQRKRMHRDCIPYIELVGLDVSPNDVAGALTTPQQQLLEIAHAVATHARIIILDEPSSSLATHDARKLMDLVRRLRSAGQTVILVSHDFEEVIDIADTVTCLRDGELVTTCPIEEVDNERLIRLVTGRDIDRSARHDSDATSEVVLSVRDLTAEGVRGASFELHAGEILGIGGLVGSGRTELMLALMGEHRVLGGAFELLGEAYTPTSTYAAMRKGLALVPESRKEQGLVLGASVQENIDLAALGSLTSGLFTSRKRSTELAEKYIEQLRIKVASPDIAVESLSGGNQQKVVIASALATNPRILLLDEPTKGIDIGAKEEILGLIRELAKRGLAVLMVSSVIPELLTSCDRVLVMRGGRIVGDLDAAEAQEEDIARLALAG